MLHDQARVCSSVIEFFIHVNRVVSHSKYRGELERQFEQLLFGLLPNDCKEITKYVCEFTLVSIEYTQRLVCTFQWDTLLDNYIKFCTSVADFVRDQTAWAVFSF